MKLNENQKAELKAIRSLPDEVIDTSDIPEVLDWSNARRGVLYRPVKQEFTLLLDQYVIEWFRSRNPEENKLSQTINNILMEYIRNQTFPIQKRD